jgi:hypothetical protein
MREFSDDKEGPPEPEAAGGPRFGSILLMK